MLCQGDHLRSKSLHRDVVAKRSFCDANCAKGVFVTKTHTTHKHNCATDVDFER